MKKMQVLFHVDELEKWGLTLTNVQNFLDDVGESELCVEILANAAAVTAFSPVEVTGEAKQALQDRMATLATRGVAKVPPFATWRVKPFPRQYVADEHHDCRTPPATPLKQNFTLILHL